LLLLDTYATRLLAQALRRIRTERGLSQDDLARRIPQVSGSTLRAMDRGELPPNARTLMHVARALGVGVEDLPEGVEIKARKGRETITA
jgi:transcriptional regulator with XRE-family HTH domain